MIDRDDLWQDMLLIANISANNNMKNPDIARRYISFFESNDSFKTALGDMYLKRLNFIAEDEKTDEQCLLCRKNISTDGVICKNCLEKIRSHSASVKKQTKEPKHYETVKEEQVNEPTKPLFSLDRKNAFRIIAILSCFIIIIVLLLKINSSVISGDPLFKKDIISFLGKNNLDKLQKSMEPAYQENYGYKVAMSDQFTLCLQDKNLLIAGLKKNKKVIYISFTQEEDGYTNYTVFGVKLGDTKEDVKKKMSKAKNVREYSTNSFTWSYLYEEDKKIYIYFDILTARVSKFIAQYR